MQFGKETSTVPTAESQESLWNAVSAPSVGMMLLGSILIAG